MGAGEGLVDVASAALGLVGEKPIASLEDGSAHADLCKQHLPPALEAALEAKAWTFATEWKKLDLAPGEPGNPGFAKQFQLPPDALRVLQVTDGSGAAIDWALERGKVLANVEDVRARVIFWTEDPALWSGNFRLAVQYLLASILAVPITENRTKQADLTLLYRDQLFEAGALDGTQGKSEKRTVSWVDRVRR